MESFWQRSVSQANASYYAYTRVGRYLAVGLVAAAGAAVTALGALGVAGIQSAMEMENNVSRIQASLGVTNEKAEQLGEIAKSTFVNGWGDSLQAVSDDLVILRQNMGNLGDDTSGELLDYAYTIRDAFGGEIMESTRTASVMMKQFGIDGYEAMDLITTGFQKGGNFSDELLDTMREYAPQFKDMGLSANQMTAILVKGAEAGAWNLDKVGDAVKEFNLRAQDGSKTTTEGFEAIGLNADKMGEAIAQGGEKGQQAFVATIAALANMKDPLKQNEAGVNLFGTQWEDVRAKVITAMADGVKGLGDVEGATEKAGEALQNNLQHKAIKVWRELSTSIGENMKPVLAELSKVADMLIAKMPEITAAIDTVFATAGKVYNFIKTNWPMIETVVGSITAAVVAYNATLLILNARLIAVNTWTKIVTAAQIAWNIAMNLNPLGVVIALIAGVVAGAILLYKNFDVVKEKTHQLWAAIKSAWENVKTKTAAVWGEFKETISTAMETAKKKASEFFEPVKKWIDTIVEKWEAFKKSITSFELPKFELPSWMGGGGDSNLPGHKDGLPYVPYDNYVARLHKGERVLTAQENKDYNKGIVNNKTTTNNTTTSTVNKPTNVVVNYYASGAGEDTEFRRFMAKFGPALENI
ncbi:phage tail tape measure protein [Aneurinibacillus migulanus]|nr:phage tail tape measure protein [Aneurinibacillus migulanus]MED1619088.1 phage tail tape measure protein [Aneurinibacillus migulanus]